MNTLYMVAPYTVYLTVPDKDGKVMAVRKGHPAIASMLVAEGCQILKSTVKLWGLFNDSGMTRDEMEEADMTEMFGAGLNAVSMEEIAAQERTKRLEEDEERRALLGSTPTPHGAPSTDLEKSKAPLSTVGGDLEVVVEAADPDETPAKDDGPPLSGVVNPAEPEVEPEVDPDAPQPGDEHGD